MSTLKVDTILKRTGTGTITLGQSGDTITIPSGATMDLSNATQTGVGGDNTPSFCAVNTSTQSVPATSNTKVNFGTERWDTNSAYDTSTSRFTVPSGQAGKYHFGCQLYTNYGQSGTYGRLRFYKNGSELNQQIYADGVGIAYGISVRTNVELSVGDYMEVYFFHTRTAGAENIVSATDYTQFFGYKLIGV